MRVLLAASEVAGFAKTGGLADVAGALPAALARRGNLVAVVMPLYKSVRRANVPVERTGIVLPIPMGDRVLACRVYRSHLPNTDVPVFLIEHQPFFEPRRPGCRAAGCTRSWCPAGKADYWDNGERFVFFNRAVLELIPHLGFPPDVIHANDWQAGLIPVYLAELYRTNPGYQRMRSVFTIHNIAYQGSYPRELLNYTGLPGRLYNPAQLEHYGFNFLKSGVVFADAVNTVSPTYAREIQSAEFGCGLEGLLAGVNWKLSGIVNGCDYEHWNPAVDRHIIAPYTSETVFESKPRCQGRSPAPVPLARRPEGYAGTWVYGRPARESKRDRPHPPAARQYRGSSTSAVSWWYSATATRCFTLSSRRSAIGTRVASASIWDSATRWRTPSKRGAICS